MSGPLRIFIGYDSRETIAFHVLAHSIMARATRPIAIYPLSLQHLKRAYWRERGALETTEFSFTRFLVPYLCGFEGQAIFMDCDMLCRVDIGDVLLHVLADPGRAVYVCQHDYTPKHSTKFLGQPQTAYPMKNWSSFMLFDCAQCLMLTPDYVNSASGLELHRFRWTHRDLVGSLPLTWNWLVGEYPLNESAHVLHYTLGGPWFDETRGCDHAADWFRELDVMVGDRDVIERECVNG